MTHPSNKIDMALRETKKRRKEWVLIFILIFFFFLLSFVELRLTQLSKLLPFINSVFFFGLVNANVVILMGLLWLIFRNVGKIFLERKQNILGSRLKTKLVIAFFGFSIIPTIVLFTISALYINSSFDKWFSVKVQNTLQASLEITHSYYRTISDAGIHFAQQIAKIEAHSLKDVRLLLNVQRRLLLLDAVEFYPDAFSARILVQKNALKESPYLVPRLASDLLLRVVQGEKLNVIHQIGSGDLIRCLVPGWNQGVLVVNVHIPISLRTKVDAIVSIFDDYQDTNPLKVPMKSMYLIILIMVTLVILFAVVWMGLYLAKELTDPVQRLVEGSHLVGAGNLDVQIVGSGYDEISVLVRAFNKMTQDLKENQRYLLQITDALEKRGAQLEAILTSIGTGVFVIDQYHHITVCNPIAEGLLGLKSESILGQSFESIFIGMFFPLQELIQKAFLIQQALVKNNDAQLVQFSVTIDDTTRLLNACAKPLRRFNQEWGVVIALDDTTYVVKSQREVAWREVARRIAHEIKNPLTPIKLSAQRMQRRFSHLIGTEKAVMQSCTEMIIQQTDALKEMVNEFSNFARLPEILLTLNDLNRVLQEVIVLFEQAHSEIRWMQKFDPHLPPMHCDRDQIKRVMMNLFDNALSALSEGGVLDPLVCVETKYLETLKLVQIEVFDNGPGISDAMKACIFEPYFSTKKAGTGLGLAIVKRIINDHNGVIRLKASPEKGAHFYIELPISFL